MNLISSLILEVRLEEGSLERRKDKDLGSLKAKTNLESAISCTSK